jgi:hypothetical protein
MLRTILITRDRNHCITEQRTGSILIFKYGYFEKYFRLPSHFGPFSMPHYSSWISSLIPHKCPQTDQNVKMSLEQSVLLPELHILEQPCNNLLTFSSF